MSMSWYPSTHLGGHMNYLKSKYDGSKIISTCISTLPKQKIMLLILRIISQH